MTEEDKSSILETSPEDAAKDICSYVEDSIIYRTLTENEKRNLSIKTKYWCVISEQRQNLIIQNNFKKLASDMGFSRPPYKVDYAHRTGEPE